MRPFGGSGYTGAVTAPITKGACAVGRIRLWIFLVCASLSASGFAQQSSGEHAVEQDWVSFRLIPRTPDQVRAFYAGRSFPEGAIDLLAKHCFVTVIIENRSPDILWLDLGDWRFIAADLAPQRRDRSYWQDQWQRLDLPPANRATFGWTILPEVRDLYPTESVGGNLTLDDGAGPFSIEAHFQTGPDRKGVENQGLSTSVLP